MTIYNLYIFARDGSCLHYAEWNRHKQSGLEKDEEFKLMYGMLFSLKSFISRISPTDQREGLHSIKTSKYKLHFYETPSGLKFIIITDDIDMTSVNVRTLLHDIYQTIYVRYVVKNPMCDLSQPISSEIFGIKLDNYIRALPIFNSKPT